MRATPAPYNMYNSNPTSFGGIAKPVCPPHPTPPHPPPPPLFSMCSHASFPTSRIYAIRDVKAEIFDPVYVYCTRVFSSKLKQRACFNPANTPHVHSQSGIKLIIQINNQSNNSLAGKVALFTLTIYFFLSLFQDSKQETVQKTRALYSIVKN